MEKKEWNRRVPLTPRGLFILLFAGGLLITGILRRDLAALFWSSAFLLAIAYSLGGGWLLILRYHLFLRKGSPPPRLILPGGGVTQGEAFAYSIRLSAPRLIIPGMIPSYRILLTAANERKLQLSHTLGAGENLIRGESAPAYRGLYTTGNASFLFRDMLGFTCHRLDFPATETLRVLPRVHQTDKLPYKSPANRSADRSLSKRPLDQLLDVRKYYFGDDTRKINWKMLAHLGELYIRKGEESPPPDSRLIFILDVTLPPGMARPLRSFYLDAFVESIASLMLGHLKGEHSLQLTVPGWEEVACYSSTKRRELIEKMAEIRWQKNQHPCPLPAGEAYSALVFSSPGSPGLPSLLSALRKRGWQINLFLKDFNFPLPVKPRSPLSGLLFLPTENTSGMELERFEKTFKSELHADLRRYRQPAWRLQNAGII